MLLRRPLGFALLESGMIDRRSTDRAVDFSSYMDDVATLPYQVIYSSIHINVSIRRDASCCGHRRDMNWISIAADGRLHGPSPGPCPYLHSLTSCYGPTTHFACPDRNITSHNPTLFFICQCAPRSSLPVSKPRSQPWSRRIVDAGGTSCDSERELDEIKPAEHFAHF
jgi:hypothetical protein